MNAEIQRHHGRVIDSPGDNLLAEFASIVDAVKCALDIQERLKIFAADIPEDQRMPFRIGVNLGDVIVDGQRIYGDGVNIAARLEGLADAGGGCLSGSAYDQIQNKLAFGGEYIGEQQVKNIATPIKVYKIWSDPDADGHIVSERKPAGARRFWPACDCHFAGRLGRCCGLLYLAGLSKTRAVYRYNPIAAAGGNLIFR